jgi:hypothetical protein
MMETVLSDGLPHDHDRATKVEADSCRSRVTNSQQIWDSCEPGRMVKMRIWSFPTPSYSNDVSGESMRFVEAGDLHAQNTITAIVQHLRLCGFYQ